MYRSRIATFFIVLGHRCNDKKALLADADPVVKSALAELLVCNWPLTGLDVKKAGHSEIGDHLARSCPTPCETHHSI